MSKINKCFVLFIVLLIIPVILFSPIRVKAEGSESDNANAGSIVKENIVNIVSSNKANDTDKNIIVKQQNLKVKIIEGKHNGEEVDISHDIQPFKPDNIEFKTGDEVFLTISEDNTGKINSAGVYQIVRQKQLKESNPQISNRDVIRAGMSVGRIL
ncbi:hypothetical protein ACYUJ6_09755 [Clostridium sp. JNZ X4-2]